MNMKTTLAIPLFLLLAGCNPPSPRVDSPALQTAIRDSAGNVAAASGGPCLFKGTKYSNGAASCQSGLQYRCSDGEWVGPGAACTDEGTAPQRPCQFQGVTFPTGAASCQAGTQYRCEDSIWRSVGTSCPGEPARLVPGRARTCIFGDVTVADASTVCRSGTTFECSDGEWINLGTLCR